jgi:hypothetical protein
MLQRSAFASPLRKNSCAAVAHASVLRPAKASATYHGDLHAEQLPVRESVRQNQPVVCSLHRGLVRGLLDRVAPDAVLERFVPHDPDDAGCEIEIGNLV